MYKIIVTSLLLSVSLFFGSCAPTSQIGPKKISVNGSFIHQHANFEFPEKINKYSRVSLVLYSPDSSDVSAGYNIKADLKNITATVYLTNKTSYQTKTSDILEDVYSSSVNALHSHYRDVKEIEVHDLKFQNKYNGKSGIYLYQFPNTNETIQSEIRLFLIQDWFLKFRISYPIGLTDYIRPEVDSLISYFELNLKEPNSANNL
jgi:hypothetical protein